MTDNQKITIDEESCIGCALCQSTAPEYYDVSSGVAEAIKNYDQKDQELIQETIDNCPAQAIRLEK